MELAFSHSATRFVPFSPRRPVGATSGNNLNARLQSGRGCVVIGDGTAAKNEQTELMDEERKNKHEEYEALNRL